MRVHLLPSFRKITLALFFIFFLFIILISYLSYDPSKAPMSPIFHYAFTNHVWIMTILIIASVVFGFVVSQIYYSELIRTKKTSQGILETVLLFLNPDEQHILDCLVNRNGETNQAEIARLNSMGRVKAHRALQRLQDKNIIDIIPHGKIRKIRLRSNILNTLRERNI